MRQIVAGIDGSGRSCVVKESNISAPATDTAVHEIFETVDGLATPPPPGSGKSIDLGVPVGGARLRIIQGAPGMTAEIHHTDTFDFAAVLDGSIDLVLDDGSHRLEAGDCALITGVDHGWLAGPEGCTFAAFVIGIPPLVGKPERLEDVR